MSPKDALKDYRAKRHPRRTPEPSGRARRPRGTKPRFVIQQHDATSLHFDVRLEADGVLKSWAVPKGPSTDPRDKRLAMPTEDHPLDYADFEGVIPEGEYGAGPVIVWDAGTFRNLTQHDGREIPVARALRDGHVSVWLEGTKLRGGYAFTRVARGKRDRWILVKEDDTEADARRKPVATQPESVVSGRTIRDVAHEERTQGTRR
jgi:DNA ligase D-like protein (predicted 3'-phosphoesterase)